MGQLQLEHLALVLELVEALVFEHGLARELVIVEVKSGCLITLSLHSVNGL